MRTLTKLAVLFMMVAATVSCTKDEIITPAVEVEETNTIVVRVNGETYRLGYTNYPLEDPNPQYYINSKAAAVWLGLPDTEADFDVLRDRAANLTIEVVSYTDDLTESKVRGIIYDSLILALYDHTDLSYSWIGGVLWDGVDGGGSPFSGNRRYTVIFL